MSIKTFKIFSRLFSYPSAELQQSLPELAEILRKEQLFEKSECLKLANWMNSLSSVDLIDWQQDYVSIFDGSVSLYLFEYLHGQSKDRGQAMVDLSAYYHQQHFQIIAGELPDYLPLILEFLSEQDPFLIKEFLSDMLKIIAQIGFKLKQHQSEYSLICDAIEIFMGQTPRTASPIIPIQVLSELDKTWQEPAVTFDGGSNCSSCKI
jgi:nitrate reductase delta subunit